MRQRDNHPELLLVGSVGLQSTEEVFRAVSESIGDRVRRIPDGETGARTLWVYWPRKVLESNSAFEVDPEEGARGTRATAAVEGIRRWIGNEAAAQGQPPPPRMRLRNGVDPKRVKLDRLGYAEVAAYGFKDITPPSPPTQMLTARSKSNATLCSD